MKGSTKIAIFLLVASFVVVPLAQAQQTYKFGFQIPLTGPAAAYGRYARTGMELALEEINGKGGVDGRKLEPIMVDDQMNTTVAVNVIKRFISVDRVPLVLGSMTATALALVPVADQAKVVFLTGLVTHPAVAKMSPWAFRLAIDMIKTSEAVAEYSFKKGHRRVGLLVLNNESTRRMSEAIKMKFEALGGKVVAMEILPEGADYRSTILKVKAANPEAIHVASFIAPAALVTKQIAELGWKIPIYHDNPMEDPILFKTAGDAAEGIIYGTVGPDDPKVWDEFAAKYKARYGEDPEIFSAHYYDIAHAIAEAIKRGGYSAEGIRKALLGIKNMKGVSGNITFDADGNVDLPVVIKTVKNRKYLRISE